MLEHYRATIEGTRAIACRIDSQRDEQVSGAGVRA